MDNPFWNFTLAVYNRSGVAEACIRLQDECGADVNLVLFILWQAFEGREMTSQGVAEVEAAVGEWQGKVVRPLRESRRWLKKNPLPDGSSGGLREKIKNWNWTPSGSSRNLWPACRSPGIARRTPWRRLPSPPWVITRCC